MATMKFAIAHITTQVNINMNGFETFKNKLIKISYSYTGGNQAKQTARKRAIAGYWNNLELVECVSWMLVCLKQEKKTMAKVVVESNDVEYADDNVIIGENKENGMIIEVRDGVICCSMKKVETKTEEVKVEKVKRTYTRSRKTASRIKFLEKANQIKADELAKLNYRKMEIEGIFTVAGITNSDNDKQVIIKRATNAALKRLENTGLPTDAINEIMATITEAKEFIADVAKRTDIMNQLKLELANINSNIDKLENGDYTQEELEAYSHQHVGFNSVETECTCRDCMTSVHTIIAETKTMKEEKDAIIAFFAKYDLLDERGYMRPVTNYQDKTVYYWLWARANDAVKNGKATDASAVFNENKKVLVEKQKRFHELTKLIASAWEKQATVVVAKRTITASGDTVDVCPICGSSNIQRIGFKKHQDNGVKMVNVAFDTSDLNDVDPCTLR